MKSLVLGDPWKSNYFEILGNRNTGATGGAYLPGGPRGPRSEGGQGAEGPELPHPGPQERRPVSAVSAYQKRERGAESCVRLEDSPEKLRNYQESLGITRNNSREVLIKPCRGKSQRNLFTRKFSLATKSVIQSSSCRAYASG